MDRALRRADAWGLDDDRLTTRKDLKAAELDAAISSFLAAATEGETLLLYFAGHGRTEDNERYLLPIDFKPGRLDRGLPAAKLWQAIAASKAERVLWKGGQRQQIKVPLDGLSAGDYRVEVEPCRAEKACGEEPPAKFKIRVGGP